MTDRALEGIRNLYFSVEPMAVSLWHFLPVWVRYLIVLVFGSSFLIATLQLIVGRNNFKRWGRRASEQAFNIAASAHHNFGNIISDTISGVSLIAFGWAAAEKLQGRHSIWFWITLVFSSYRAIRKHVTVTTTGREFKIFFENRSAAAQALHIHNEKYPPVPKAGFNYRTSSVTKDFVEDIVENHLDFLHRTLRLGFSWYGKDNYSASLLIYDAKKQEWHKWGTVFERGISPSKVRPGSKWPLARQAFKLSDPLYSRNRPRQFDVQRHETNSYASFLTIPLYFRRNGAGPHSFEIKGELFGALSYTNSNPETFSNLTAEKFLKYFALEMAVVERLAFRIYRDYNF